MGGPAWLTEIFAAASLAVAVHARAVVVARWGHRPIVLDTDGAHVIMGVAMAGMPAPACAPATAIWEVVFAAAAAWSRPLARPAAAPSPARALLPPPPAPDRVRRDGLHVPDLPAAAVRP